MKFIWALIVMLLMGIILAVGIVWASHGHPWLLILGTIGFLAAFARIGCLGH